MIAEPAVGQRGDLVIGDALEDIGQLSLTMLTLSHSGRSALNVGFSIAALVKGFLVTSCYIPSARRSALADVAARGSCFSSRLARGHLMMG